MTKLTIFTPTFNRMELLGRGYQALCRQNNHYFCWLIIDDGSVDNTRQEVESWIDETTKKSVEGGFEGNSIDASWLHIRYYYKENGGLHTGYNKAIELMDTEICVCIDSDDYMPDDAVKTIIEKWEKYNTRSIAGLVGLDYIIGRERIGSSLPEGKVTHYIKLKESKQYNCDNKIVMRVDLLKQVAPQPSFTGEKNFNPIWMILKVDQLYPFVLINDNLCYVDYQEGGMSYNLINQYFNSPNSFLELRKLYISLQYASTLFKLKNHIHLVSQCLIAKKSISRESPNYLISVLCFPIGAILYCYMLWKHNSFIRG